LATAEFIFNNKIHTATKILLIKVNYKQELRMGFEIERKEKHVKTEKFVEKMKEKAKLMLKKSQEEMRKYIDRNKKEIVKCKVGDRVSLSIKNLVW